MDDLWSTALPASYPEPQDCTCIELWKCDAISMCQNSLSIFSPIIDNWFWFLIFNCTMTTPPSVSIYMTYAQYPPTHILCPDEGQPAETLTVCHYLHVMQSSPLVFACWLLLLFSNRLWLCLSVGVVEPPSLTTFWTQKTQQTNNVFELETDFTYTTCME